MAETIYNYSYTKGAYNKSGSLVNDAYLFRIEAILNSVDKTNKKANVTINWYITGQNGFSYSGHTGINTEMALRYNVSSGNYTKVKTGTMNSCTPTGKELLMLSYTANYSLTEGAAYNIDYKFFYDGGESKNYLPRLHTQYGRITIPAQTFYINVWRNDGGTLKQAEKCVYNNGGTLKEVIAAYYNDGGTLKRIW